MHKHRIGQTKHDMRLGGARQCQLEQQRWCWPRGPGAAVGGPVNSKCCSDLQYRKCRYSSSEALAGSDVVASGGCWGGWTEAGLLALLSLIAGRGQAPTASSVCIVGPCCWLNTGLSMHAGWSPCCNSCSICTTAHAVETLAGTMTQY
jgi:hypothetical protein